MIRKLSMYAHTFNAKKPSFHKRPLPTTLVAMASPHGKKIFQEAMLAGGMESYFPLAEQFITQSEPSFCSISSLAMVLNALNFDPRKVWKGAWRWVSEETLQCDNTQFCGHTLDKIKSEGLSFRQFESLARCNGVRIAAHKVLPVENKRDLGFQDGSCVGGYELFKSYVESLSYDEKAEQFMVVNFSRGVLGQTGDGHYSPIGGYHKEQELVLIMDVARFKYPPYWVPLRLLWRAMAEPDSLTGEPRGYCVISGWSNNSKHALGHPQPQNDSEGALKEYNYEYAHTHSTTRKQHGLKTESTTNFSSATTLTAQSESFTYMHNHTSKTSDADGDTVSTRSVRSAASVTTSLGTSAGMYSFANKTVRASVIRALDRGEDVNDAFSIRRACPPRIRTWEEVPKLHSMPACCAKHAAGHGHTHSHTHGHGDECSDDKHLGQ